MPRSESSIAQRNSYTREHYRRNSSIYKARARKYTDRIRSENRVKVKEYLEDHPCVDCGISEIVVLEFDHVRGKKVNHVCTIVNHGFGWDSIKAEIDKCEVRCANCHRRKTAKEREISLATLSYAT